jgi:hypothetical protein
LPEDSEPAVLDAQVAYGEINPTQSIDVIPPVKLTVPADIRSGPEGVVGEGSFGEPAPAAADEIPVIVDAVSLPNSGFPADLSFAGVTAGDIAYGEIESGLTGDAALLSGFTVWEVSIVVDAMPPGRSPFPADKLLLRKSVPGSVLFFMAMLFGPNTPLFRRTFLPLMRLPPKAQSLLMPVRTGMSHFLLMMRKSQSWLPQCSPEVPLLWKSGC